MHLLSLIKGALGAIVVSLAAVGCASADASDGLASDEGALGASTCAGNACAALARPKPLVRGGMAAVGDQLFWIEAGAAADGSAIDELRHCKLPACSSVDALPLVLANGTALRASGLRSARDHVFFIGDTPGVAQDSLFLADGQSFQQVVAQFDGQREEVAVDEIGIAIYTKGGSLRHCAYAPGGATLVTRCTSASEAFMRFGESIALTPTRVLLLRPAGVVSLDRATLGDRRDEHIFTASGAARVAAIGELAVGVTTSVDSQGGVVTHDTLFQRDSSPGFGAFVPGVLQASVVSGNKLYAATVGEGDVLHRASTGAIGRIASTGQTKLLATQQDAHAVATAGARVFWLDAALGTDAEDPVGVIRSVRK